MKILKYIAIAAGIFFILALILRKSVKTKIVLSGYDPAKKTVTIEVYSNGVLSNTYTCAFSPLTKTSVQANDYRLEVGSLLETNNRDGLVAFNVLNDQGQSITQNWFDFSKPKTYTIFEEK